MKFKLLSFVFLLIIASCRSSGPTNKAILSKNKPSKEIVSGYKEGAKKMERSEKRRLKQEANKRYKKSKQFENNKIR